MSILNLLGTDAVQKQLLKILADKAKKAGIKQILITINPDGGFDSEIPKEDSLMVTKKTFEVLNNFYQSNKNK